MKLPEYCSSEEYAQLHVGQKSATLLHNEQIAAQLTVALITNYRQVALTDKEGNTIVAPYINVAEAYREYLDKLNKGTL